MQQNLRPLVADLAVMVGLETSLTIWSALATTLSWMARGILGIKHAGRVVKTAGAATSASL